MIEQMPESAPYHDLDEPPTEEELQLALTKMKRCKAGGKSGILPELVLFGGAVSGGFRGGGGGGGGG